MRLPFAAGAAVLVATILVRAQTADSPLSAYINSIRDVDNHAHVVAPDAEHDTGYDALPCDALGPPSGPPPAGFRFGPDYLSAWRTLYGFTGRSEADIDASRRAQAAVRRQRGSSYFGWVLDQAGVEFALANRVMMAPELDAQRFVWVPYADALLFPLDNSAEKALSPDRKVFYEREEQLLKRYRTESRPAGVTTFDQYVSFVNATLSRQKTAGAVAIKFEAAYLRSLDFAPSDRAAASAVYGRFASRGIPSRAEYKTLQDYLFRFIAEQAGRLGLAVHIHTGNGCGEYFDLQGSNPLLLLPALNDPMLRKTAFVLLHGGEPFEREVTALLEKPNVYADSSMMEFLWSAQELGRTLRFWLERVPEHVLFGTDAGPTGPGFGWEETTWVGSRKMRQALTQALASMTADGVVSAARAREIARRVLRDNALELYHLKSSR